MKIQSFVSWLPRMFVYTTITLLMVNCGVGGELSYQPTGIPIEISVDTNGNIQLSGAVASLPTPIGTFSIGVIVDPAKHFGVENTLTVRFNGQDHIYDLHGQDFDVKFQPGYYEQVQLKKIKGNVLLELRRAELTPASIVLQPQPQSQSVAPTRSAPPTRIPQKCDIEVHSEFRQVWERAGGVAAGCPTGPAYQKPVAYQPFQNGFMLWRVGPHSVAGGMIYVVYNSGKWQEYYDQWVDGMEERGNYAPPPGLFEPKLGFGFLWRTQLGGPNAEIGWALADETGSDFGLIQDFPNNAAIFRYPGQLPVFMPNGKSWVR